MYTLKSIAQRGTLFGAAAALVLAAVLPSTAVFADALNPLTDRSLALSSSSPGWSHTDGSENGTYAPPNSGANGQKTGNTFSFKVSTDSTGTPVKAMTLQYCTVAAGDCIAPGDDAVKGTDTATTSDLNVNFPSPLELSGADFGTVVDTNATTNPNGAVIAVPGYGGYQTGKPGETAYIGGAAGSVAGNYVVYYNNAGTWTPSSGWAMTTSSVTAASATTPAKNFITLVNTTGLGITPGTQVKIVFFGTGTNYITNPGSKAFFVRMNTYKAYDDTTTPGTVILDPNDILDGGVTVANIMNQSIWIQTKVLETMAFSVGTVDPNTLSSTDGAGSPSTYEKAKFADVSSLTGTSTHIPCDTIASGMLASKPSNVLQLGDTGAENSLDSTKTYSTHSYWRLSSNSSAGATVYYSGHTLTNTVGDEIKAIGAAATAPQQGAEQFGLALDNTDTSGTSQSDLKVNYAADPVDATTENGADAGSSTAVHASTLTDAGGNASWHLPTLYPLQPVAAYSHGSGKVNGTPTTQFAFVPTSDTIPVPIASENSQVVDCVTAKVRYIANIAATTPAGIYTTKVNYIAAPQY